jgi:hypothetical protein
MTSGLLRSLFRSQSVRDTSDSRSHSHSHEHSTSSRHPSELGSNSHRHETSSRSHTSTPRTQEYGSNTSRRRQGGSTNGLFSNIRRAESTSLRHEPGLYDRSDHYYRSYGRGDSARDSHRQRYYKNNRHPELLDHFQEYQQSRSGGRPVARPARPARTGELLSGHGAGRDYSIRLFDTPDRSTTLSGVGMSRSVRDERSHPRESPSTRFDHDDYRRRFW